jgi:cellulose synthase/poly-beta-1,6-N-acetylglucosamine synthase-like glycosyltransferase
MVSPLIYSIVLPAYNESQRIASSLDQILAHGDKRQWSFEVIVVDDGSTDGTAQIVDAYARKYPSLRLIESPENRGKGYSVRQGMFEARGDVLLFSDTTFPRRLPRRINCLPPPNVRRVTFAPFARQGGKPISRLVPDG